MRILNEKILKNIVEYERFHIYLYASKRRKYMPAVLGNLGSCPICSKKTSATMGFLRKCLISLEPPAYITVCTSNTCCYFDSDDCFKDLPEPSALVDANDFSALDATLYFLVNSVYLRLSFQNNNIPNTDILSDILRMTIKENKLICEVRTFILLHFKSKCNLSHLGESFNFICDISNFVKKSLRTTWQRLTQCANFCPRKSSETENVAVFCSSFGSVELGATPTISSSMKQCPTCSRGEQSNLSRVEQLSDFLVIHAQNGIELPFESGRTSFKSKEGFVYRLHSVTLSENFGFSTYLCDSVGHLREQFDSFSKVPKSCGLKLITIKPSAIRFVVFEKVFDSFGIFSPDSSRPTSTQSVCGRKSRLSFFGSSSSNSSSADVINAKRAASVVSGPVMNKRIKVSSDHSVFDPADRKFASYSTQGKQNSANCNDTSEALNWRKQFQKRFSTIDNSLKKAKISSYIATLQSLNVKIIESETNLSAVRSAPLKRGRASGTPSFSDTNSVNSQVSTPSPSPSPVISKPLVDDLSGSNMKRFLKSLPIQSSTQLVTSSSLDKGSNADHAHTPVDILPDFSDVFDALSQDVFSQEALNSNRESDLLGTLSEKRDSGFDLLEELLKNG